jgi:hypothetical protein
MLYFNGTYLYVQGATTNSTYSNITTAEVDAGTSTAGRTISGQMSAYILGKAAPLVHTHATSDVTGLDTALAGKVAATTTVNGQALSANVTLTQDNVGDGTTHKQYSQTEKTKLAGIATGATANSSDATLLARANHTGTQAISTLATTGTASASTWLRGDGSWASLPAGTTVDELTDLDTTVTGAQLDALKTKVDGVEAGATANSSDATLLARANHTGTQAISTITDLQTTLDAKQPLDADLTTLAGLTATTNNVIQSVSGAWASRTPAQLKATLSLVKADVGLGNVDNTADSAKSVASAATLTTARTINGVSFNGSANITINAVDSTAREPAITAGTTAQYWRGDKSWQTLNQDVVPDGTTNKAYTATEKTKLAGIATGATANSSDATLLNRANHTGSQAISTVTSLQTTLDAKQPLDATLTALAGVTTAANKLIYASGVDTFLTTDLTAAARNLLDDADAAAMRTTLGLGTAATTASTAYATAAQGALAASAVQPSLTTTAGLGFVVDEDDMVSDSPTKVPTQQSVKAYLDAFASFASGAIGSVQDNVDLKADKTITVTAGTGLTGGGDLSASRTLSANFGTAAGTICQGNDARLSDARTPTTHAHTAADLSGVVKTADTATTGYGFVVDEDNMASNSATKVPTQQSVKAYVDAKPGLNLAPTATQTGDYTALANDMVMVDAAAAAVITLPNIPADGALVGVFLVGATSANVTLAAGGSGQLMYASSDITSYALRSDGASVDLSVWRYNASGNYWHPMVLSADPSSTDIVDSTDVGRALITVSSAAEALDLLGGVSEADFEQLFSVDWQQPLLDATTAVQTQAFTSATSGALPTFTITVADGACVVVPVFGYRTQSEEITLSVTCDGVAMTKVNPVPAMGNNVDVDAANASFLQYFILEDVIGGDNDIVVSWSAPAAVTPTISALANSWTGVDSWAGYSADGGTESGTTMSQTVVSATGRIVLQAFAHEPLSGGTTVSAYNQTKIADLSGGTFGQAVFGWAPGAAVVNFTATRNSSVDYSKSAFQLVGVVSRESVVLMVDDTSAFGRQLIDAADAAAARTLLGLDSTYSAGGTDVAVADGGTGRSSHTAYALIAGGITTTGAQQSLATGTSGQVLKSGGASALPTWATLAKADVGLGSVDNTADTAKNVLSATKLTTARTINGVSFDGTANITVADSTKTPTTRTITAGTGLTGGGDLSADRSLAVSFGIAAGTVCQGNDSRLSDARTPTDSSVTNAKVAAGAAIALSKLATGYVQGADNSGPRTLTVWVGSEAQYAAIGTKDANTIYARYP